MIKDCYHLFCFECIRLWANHLMLLQSFATCPLCKRQFTIVFTDLKVGDSNYSTVSLTTMNERGLYVRQAVYARRIKPTPRDEESLRIPRKTFSQLVSWIERDLRICLGPEEDTTLLLVLIQSLLDRYEWQLDKLETELQDFLFDKTDIFVQELYFFATSPWSMEAYDKEVPYQCIHAECTAQSCLRI